MGGEQGSENWGGEVGANLSPTALLLPTPMQHFTENGHLTENVLNYGRNRQLRRYTRNISLVKSLVRCYFSKDGIKYFLRSDIGLKFYNQVCCKKDERLLNSS